MIDLRLGDCLEVMKSIPENSVNLVFTSPPYNLGKNKMYNYYNDNLSNEDYYNLLNNSLLQSIRICKGLIFYNLNFSNTNRKIILKWLLDNNLILRDIIVWDKKFVQPPIGNIFGKRCEFIFVFSKYETEINNFKVNKAKNYYNIFGSWLSNICSLSIKQDTADSNIHRAGFPINLPRIFIDMYTNKNDVILDPFMGSGSTIIASLELGRQAIGIELCKEYFKIAENRINQTMENLI